MTELKKYIWNRLREIYNIYPFRSSITMPQDCADCKLEIEYDTLKNILI